MAPQAADFVTAELSKTNKAKKLKGFEAVRGVILEPNPFTVSAPSQQNPLHVTSSDQSNNAWLGDGASYSLLQTFLTVHSKMSTACSGVIPPQPSLCSRTASGRPFPGQLGATERPCTSGSQGFTAVRVSVLLPQVEDDLMTPSMKLKRPQLQKKYQKQIDTL